MKNPFPKRLLPPAPAYTLPLSRSAFRKALICGQGRAVLHVQQFGVEGVEDLILEACVKNPDIEVCDGRSEHLWLLVEAAGLQEKLLPTLREAMNTMCPHQLYFQHFDLLIKLHRAGHQEALEVIKAHTLRDGLACDYAVFPRGLDYWMRQSPEEAVLAMMAAYGEAINAGRDPDWTPWIEFHDDEALMARCHALVAAHAEESEAARAFARTQCEMESASSAYTKIDWSQLSAEEIIAWTSDENRHGFSPCQTGEKMSESTAQELYRLMNSLDQWRHYLRTLEVFQYRKAPELDPDWLRFAAWGSRRARASWISIRVLSHFDDPRILRVAKKLNSSKCSWEVHASLELMKSHCPASAQRRLRCWLQRLTRSSYRDIGRWSFRSQLDYAYSDPAFERLKELEPWAIWLLNNPTLAKNPRLAGYPMLWLYENCPCSLCRSRAFEALAAAAPLPPEILAEALYDAYSLTRDRATTLLAGETP